MRKEAVYVKGISTNFEHIPKKSYLKRRRVLTSETPGYVSVSNSPFSPAYEKSLSNQFISLAPYSPVRRSVPQIHLGYLIFEKFTLEKSALFRTSDLVLI